MRAYGETRFDGYQSEGFMKVSRAREDRAAAEEVQVQLEERFVNDCDAGLCDACMDPFGDIADYDARENAAALAWLEAHR